MRQSIPPTGPIRPRKESPVVGIGPVKAEGSDFESYLGPAAIGGEAALTALIREFSSMVFQVALTTTGSAADAEDVMQEVFIGLPEALATYRRASFPAWLKQLTRNRALMRVRSDTRRRDRARSFATDERVEESTLNRIMIEECLAAIGGSLREVFVLKEWQGLTHAEIGACLGISENASQVRLHRAKAALRGLLGD